MNYLKKLDHQNYTNNNLNEINEFKEINEIKEIDLVNQLNQLNEVNEYDEINQINQLISSEKKLSYIQINYKNKISNFHIKGYIGGLAVIFIFFNISTLFYNLFSINLISYYWLCFNFNWYMGIYICN